MNHLPGIHESQEWYVAEMRDPESRGSLTTPKVALVEAANRGMLIIVKRSLEIAYLSVAFWALWERLDTQQRLHKHRMRPDIGRPLTVVRDEEWERALVVIEPLIVLEEIDPFIDLLTPFDKKTP